MKQLAKKILSFLAICVYVLAGIGGTGYLFYYGHPVFGVANIGLLAMAYPMFKKAISTIIGE